MINEWSSNVPAQRRYELMSIGFLVLFILFGGIASTIAIVYLLVCILFILYVFSTLHNFAKVFKFEIVVSHQNKPLS